MMRRATYLRLIYSDVTSPSLYVQRVDMSLRGGITHLTHRVTRSLAKLDRIVPRRDTFHH